MMCTVDTDCILWNFPDGVPTPSPKWVLGNENDVECLSSGLYAPKALQVVACSSSDAYAADGVQGGALLNSIVQSHSLTLANPTDDRVMFSIVQIQFGATRFAMTAFGGAVATDLYQYGPVGSMTPSGFNYIGESGILDGNNSVPEARTIIEVPGRGIGFTVCPALGPGVSLEVQLQRRASAQGLSGTLQDFLYQPSTIQAWGIVV